MPSLNCSDLGLNWVEFGVFFPKRTELFPLKDYKGHLVKKSSFKGLFEIKDSRTYTACENMPRMTREKICSRTNPGGHLRVALKHHLLNSPLNVCIGSVSRNVTTWLLATFMLCVCGIHPTFPHSAHDSAAFSNVPRHVSRSCPLGLQ